DEMSSTSLVHDCSPWIIRIADFTGMRACLNAPCFPVADIARPRQANPRICNPLDTGMQCRDALTEASGDPRCVRLADGLCVYRTNTEQLTPRGACTGKEGRRESTARRRGT